ncbi:hypothetical protein ACFFU9_05220 [Mariniflexile ostreae]|uniref:Phosphate-selective porin O/P n=1 Tax=Mariniflexile ostreae TaxID=1520892 RepID=A0ABV5F9M4_9FLAO
MLKKIFLVAFIFNTILNAQHKDSYSIKNGIDQSGVLPTHHFGIFSSRIHQNFKTTSLKKAKLSVAYTSGNTFHPFVEAYLPKSPELRKKLSQTLWNLRKFDFIDQETTPATYMNIVVDAVIKEFRFRVDIPLNKKNELNMSLRSHLITKGNYPLSFFSSDETIEWFHSHIAGGEDPYGRRYYGLNRVNFKYTDRNGRVMKLYNNAFFISGIEFSHHYYPSFLFNTTHNIHLNLGSHLGLNTSTFNASIDLGVSVNGVKKIKFKNKNEFHVGVGLNILRKNILNFKDVMDLGNNRILGNVVGNIEFTKYTKTKSYHAFGLDYQLQTRYNKQEEASYYKLLGKWNEVNAGWHHGVSTLYKSLSTWTFIYTYGRPSYKFSLFFMQDLSVNNAPDFQTGIKLTLPI